MKKFNVFNRANYSSIVVAITVSVFFNTLRAQQVDPFTGGFSTGMNLMQVPSPDGMSIPISASYFGGITVNQPSSEIGLGWNLSVGGAITRSVYGLPDDWNAKNTVNPQNTASGTQPTTHYGSFYPYCGAAPGCKTPTGTDKAFDLYTNVDSPYFAIPNYDKYSVSAPNLSGSLAPHVFNYATITRHSTSNIFYPGVNYVEGPPGNWSYTGLGRNFSSYIGASKRPQFNFAGDFADTLISRHFQSYPFQSANTAYLPAQSVAYNSVTVNTPYMGAKGANYAGFDTTKGRLWGTRYVEYFTNTEVNSWNNGTSGYLDLPMGKSRSSTNFDMDGIGAYRITDAGGMVYHFTLPVYVNYTWQGSFPLKNDYTLNSYTNVTTVIYGNDTIKTLNDFNNYVSEYRQSVKYAYQWLLTAITGPDYVDANNNGKADIGDKGYWASFEYKKWTNNFTQRYPKFGLNYSFNGTEKDKLPDAALNAAGKINGKFGVYSIANMQIYYLNKIRTSTNTAVFVRDIRNDEAADNRNTAGSTNATQPSVFIPQLKLSKIVLFNNDDWASIPSPSNITTGSSSWTLAPTTADSALFYDSNWYTTNQSTIESRSLQTIEFNQDYSLARNYYRNVNAPVGQTCHLDLPAHVKSVIPTGGTYSTSGKLTLNKIYIYKYQHTQVDPPVLYDYNYSNSTDNPDYNPQKIDYWGFYKSDVTSNAYSGYVTSTSKDYTDAWSLRTITKPEGGTVNIAYESNTYDRVLGGVNYYQGPIRTYAIKSIACPSGGTTGKDFGFALEDSTTEFWTYAANSSYNSTRHVMIPYTSDVASGGNYTKHISSGTFTITTPPTTNKLTNVQYIQTSDGDDGGSSNPQLVNCYTSGGGATPFNGTSCGNVLTYPGRAYISFKLPVGTNEYGGGVRVKSLTMNNGSTDSYIQNYTYTKGVATSEADRFSTPKQLPSDPGCGGYNYHMKLRGNESDPFRLGPMIGYSKVTVQNMGQSAVNSANGSTDYYFLTNDSLYKNFQRNIVTKTINGNSGYVYEIIDEFSSAWGLPTETRVSDKNGNMISRSTNTIKVLTQGSLVENFHDVNPSGTYTDGIFIFRQFPMMITSKTEYNKDAQSTTTNLKFDEITFEPILTQVTGPNRSELFTRSKPAFRVSQFAAMGPKSQASTNYNQTNALAESRTTVDSTYITTNSNFSSFSVNPWVYQFNVREFDKVSAHKWVITGNKTLPTYFSPTSYAWAGPLSSYGLYDHTQLPSPAFDYTTQPGSANWRIGEKAVLLDYKGHVIEKVGINNRFTTFKYCDKDRIAAAQAANVNYASFVFTSFEDTVNLNGNASPIWYYSGEVIQAGGVWTDSTTIKPHTGNYTVKIPTNTYGPSWSAKYTSGMTTADSLQRARTYRASVWVHTSSPNTVQLIADLDGSTGRTYVSMAKNDASAITVGNWVQLNVEVYVPGNYTSTGGPGGQNDFRVYLLNPSGSGGDAWFDDFVVHPVDAPFSAKIYDFRTKWLNAEIDNNNFATKYKYDNGGRLSQVWKEIQGVGLKKVKSYTYNTARALN